VIFSVDEEYIHKIHLDPPAFGLYLRSLWSSPFMPLVAQRVKRNVRNYAVK